MNKMILRNQQELLCHCGNTRKAKPIRQAKARLLLILAALLFGGTGWGQVNWNGPVSSNYTFYGNNYVHYSSGTTITVEGNVTLNAPLLVLDGETITINSNDNAVWTITRSTSMITSLPMFWVGIGTSGTLTIDGKNNGLVIEGNKSNGVTATKAAVFLSENATCTLKRITIQNHKNTSDNGGAICIGASATLTTNNNCAFQNNEAPNGAGVFNSGTWTADNCTIQNNVSSSLGGGIFSNGSASLTSCNITGNTSVNGAGIYATNILSCTNCTLSSNSISNSDGSGGGIYYCGSNNTTDKLTINTCTINGNSAAYKGGGIIMHANGTTNCNGEIKGNTNIYDNSAKDAGGLALHDSNVACTLSAGTIYGNTASRNGGGVYISTNSTLTYSGGDIGNIGSGNENTATSNGGGVYIQGNLVMSAGNILNNSANQGGGVYVTATGTMTFDAGSIHDNTATSNGGGIYFNGNTFTMTGTTARSIYGNSAVNGGGVYVGSNGTFAASNSKLEIRTNSATNGGGIYSTGTLTLAGSLVGKSGGANTAERGAGVYTAGTLNIQGGNIQYNTMTGTANQGAGVYVAGGTTTMSGGAINHNANAIDGGGVYIDNGSFTQSAGEIRNHTVSGNGGGVYVASNGTFELNGGNVGKASTSSNGTTTTYYNTANLGGGVYTEGVFRLVSGNVLYNRATTNGAGVYVDGNTTTISGGAIYNNLKSSSNIYGSGVYVNSGSLTMSAGSIYNNSNAISGGGVYLNGGSFTMTGGEIYKHTVTTNGGGVYVGASCSFTMSGGNIGKSGNVNQAVLGGGVYTEGTVNINTGSTIAYNTATNATLGQGGGGIYVAAGTTTMYGGDIYGNTATTGTNTSGGGVCVAATFDMQGGAIGSSTANNQAKNGGGVCVSTGGTFTMSGGEIHDNKATHATIAYGGGGVYVQTGGTFTMSNNAIIHSNLANTTAGSGGGICLFGTFNWNGGTIYSNTAINGGGLYLGTNFTMPAGRSLYSNRATNGGGVYVPAGITFTMSGGEIYSNTATTSGGGIYTLGSVTATTGTNKIYNNQATNSSNTRNGGGVWIGTAGSFAMANGEIYNNTARNNGGGVFIDNNATASLTLTDTDVYGNTATNGAGIYKNVNAVLSITGGELYSNAAATNGGAIFINGGNDASAAALTGVSIGKEESGAYLPNTAKLGGGIYMADGTVTIQKHTTSKTDTKSYIIGNSTDITSGATGGGIHMVKGTLNISDTEIIGNTSKTTGGGIHKEAGALEIKDTEIKDNTSTTAGGGGLYSKAGVTTITNTEISGNTSTTTGGGIHMAAGTLTITDTKISNNSATSTGGGIHHVNGTINIIDSEITGNSSANNGGGIYKTGNNTTATNIYVSGVVVINNNLKGTDANNLYIANAKTKFIYIAAEGLECGSCIGITSAVGYSTNTIKIVQGDGTGSVPNDNCAFAYRNRFFFSDNGADGVFNNNASPYYSGNTNSLYFVANATYQGAMDSWLTYANASGCTLDGNGFVTAVNNAAGMAYFAQHILAGNDYSGKTVSLSADIDLSGHNWEPIGYAAECLEGNSAVFNGTFDGQGHTITNITSPFPYDNMGLFGVVGDNGVVKNTMVANINFTGTNTHTGAVAGLLNGSVYNCSAITQSGTGATDASLVGEVGADGSLKNCFVNTSATIGLANENGGTIENCYMRGATSFVGGTGTGTVNYCYAPSGSVSGTNSVYGATNLPNGKYGFAHSDQQITPNSDNTHIVNGAIDNHGELKGLLATLNHWVKASGNGWNAGTQSNSNGYALWTRTMASPINGDYPVLMMPGTVCVGSPDGTILNYAADINTLLTTYSTSGDIYLYATNPTALGGTSGTTRVYINEHVGVLQTLNTTVNARVGVTLDNSSTGYMSYDWHMFSPTLTAAPLGIVYHSGVNDNYLVKTNYSTYLSNGIPHTVYESATNMDPTKTTWSTANIGYFPTNTPYGTWRGTPDPVGSFDFYCYHEPTCHWINFKREGTSSFYDHWRENEDPTTHKHLNIPYENESSLTPGKGYLVALSQPSMLMADGVLNNGDASSGNVSINVTASDINFTGYEYTLKGINLIGNPFQSYLNFDEFASYSTNTQIGNTYYILDADKKGYVSYTVGQTDPPAPKMLHPHQGFYVKVPASQSLQFTPDMRATTGAVFRDDKPSYPLVNLVCTDGQGRNDFATVELDRPEAGGGEKVLGLHSGDASVWIHTDEADWQTAFTTPGLREVPVRFKAYKDGFFTISWNTMNADFNYMHLIDNLTGTDIDCLNADEYHFEGKVTDYSSRFRLVLEYTDVEENEDDASTGSATFAFMMGDELVVNSGSSASTETALLEMFDLNGRCLLSKELHGEQSTLHLPTTTPGIYVLRLTANRQTRTQKMVIR